MQLQADCWMVVFASRWGLVNVNIGLALLLGSSWLCAASFCVCACCLTRSAGNVTAVLVSSVSRSGGVFSAQSGFLLGFYGGSAARRAGVFVLTG